MLFSSSSLSRPVGRRFFDRVFPPSEPGLDGTIFFFSRQMQCSSLLFFFTALLIFFSPFVFPMPIVAGLPSSFDKFRQSPRPLRVCLSFQAGESVLWFSFSLVLFFRDFRLSINFRLLKERSFEEKGTGTLCFFFSLLLFPVLEGACATFFLRLSSNPGWLLLFYT